MSQQYAPKPEKDVGRRFTTGPAKSSPPRLSDVAPPPLTTSQLRSPPTVVEATAQDERQLDRLWERMRRHYRLEKISTALSQLGLSAIFGGFVTFVMSLPQTPAGKACANIALRYPTPFRAGIATLALGLVALGILLLVWAAKRWFL